MHFKTDICIIYLNSVPNPSSNWYILINTPKVFSHNLWVSIPRLLSLRRLLRLTIQVQSPVPLPMNHTTLTKYETSVCLGFSIRTMGITGGPVLWAVVRIKMGFTCQVSRSAAECTKGSTEAGVYHHHHGRSRVSLLSLLRSIRQLLLAFPSTAKCPQIPIS